MDFGDLVFFLIFIIIIVTNIIGQVKKSRRATGGSPGDSKKAEEARFESETRSDPAEAPPSRKTGWRQALDEILVEVREQAQARQRSAETDEKTAPRQPSGWDLLMGDSETEGPRGTPPLTGRKTSSKPDEKPGKKGSAVPPPPVSRARRAEPRPAMVRQRRPERVPYTPVYGIEEAAKPVKKDHYRRAAQRRIPIQDLKNAIIWHEILSPPVALRGTDIGNQR